MIYMLDTNVCIRYLNGQSESIKSKLQETSPQDIVLCSVVKAELFYGAVKSARPEANHRKITHFVNRFISLPFDDQAAEEYAEIRADLEKKVSQLVPMI